MAGTFDMLRANDLIFNYVVSNWLMGQDPPAFDILAWNGDNTRMPAAMHSFYLRSLYMRNELATRRDGTGRPAAVAGRREERHVRGGRDQRPHRALDVLLQGERAARRRTCATCCPAAGTSPGSSTRPGRRPGTRPARLPGPTAEAWRAAQSSKHDGSWWEDWAAWTDVRAGELVKPPADGQQAVPAARRRTRRVRPRLIGLSSHRGTASASPETGLSHVIRRTWRSRCRWRRGSGRVHGRERPDGRLAEIARRVILWTISPRTCWCGGPGTGIGGWPGGQPQRVPGIRGRGWR